jgi:hypothetical protein
VVDAEATLAAAHRLLNNPPSVHASRSAMEQWHHNVDQLIIATINTPHQGGGRQEPSATHSRSPSAACMPPQLRVPPSIATANFHDELIRHRT